MKQLKVTTLCPHSASFINLITRLSSVSEFLRGGTILAFVDAYLNLQVFPVDAKKNGNEECKKVAAISHPISVFFPIDTSFPHVQYLVFFNSISKKCSLLEVDWDTFPDDSQTDEWSEPNETSKCEASVSFQILPASRTTALFFYKFDCEETDFEVELIGQPKWRWADLIRSFRNFLIESKSEFSSLYRSFLAPGTETSKTRFHLSLNPSFGGNIYISNYNESGNQKQLVSLRCEFGFEAIKN